MTVAAAPGHVPHIAVLLPTRAAPQPPRLLELFVELVYIIILHPTIISSETLVYISITIWLGNVNTGITGSQLE